MFYGIRHVKGPTTKRELHKIVTKTNRIIIVFYTLLKDIAVHLLIS